MTLSSQILKDQLKKVDQCQPMNEQSITHELSEILQAIETLCEAERLDDDFFKNQAIFVQPFNKQFFLFELPFLASKYVIEFKQFSQIQNDKVNTLMQKFKQNSKKILLKSMEYSLKVYKQLQEVKALETLRLILDPERQFFKFPLLADWDDTNYIRGVETSQEQQEFTQNIKENDFIDCLKHDSRSQVVDWSRGQVVKANQIYVWIRWLGDELALNRKVLRDSWDLAPFKSKVPDSDWDWRFTLQVDDRIDCPDDNVWYNSTIIERKESSSDYPDQTPQVDYKIGFRFYDPLGNMTDMRSERRFFGWSNQYDEDMNATNPKIQPLNRYSKKFCKYASMSYAEESIKDQSDFIYEYKRSHKVYAVPRFQTKNQRRSLLMVQLTQKFGEMGGFDLILKNISNISCPIDAVHQSLVILGNLHEILIRSFCYDYIPKIWEVVQNNLLNSPDSNLRNFTSQKISETLTGLGLVLKRVYSLKEKAEMTDKLEMNIALKCFNSDFLERKLQGLKSIQDLIRKNKDFQMTMQNSDIKFLTTQILLEWINDNKIFEGLYVQNTNPHLIQRSSDFLKFMLDEHLLSISHMDMVWASVERNETEQKLAVYKLLKDVSSSLQKEHLDFIIDKICQKDESQLCKEDLESLADLIRYSYRYREEFCLKLCDYTWNIICNAQKISETIEMVIQFYIDQITSFEMRPHRSNLLSKIGGFIVNCTTSISIPLKVLIKFIEKLEIQPLSWDNFTRNVALTEIENKFQLIQSVVQSLDTIKTQSLYLDEVKARMQFIQFFYSNITTQELRLSFKIISGLWDQLVFKSSCSEERDILYKWFGSLAASGQSLTSIVSLEDLKEFFDTKIAADQVQLSELTSEGFNCFKAVFNGLNNQLGNFRIVEKKTESPQIGSQQVLYGPQREKILKFSYEVQLDPLQLYGFQILWLIVIESYSLEVSRLANEFLQEIYANVCVEIKTTLLDFLFTELERVKEEQNKVYRIILVLEETIDQSEINGPGQLVPLIVLSSSETVTISIMNDHNSGPKKVQVTLKENSSVIELRYMVAQLIRVPWDTVSLTSIRGEIKFTDNGKMIRDLRLKKGETLVASRRIVDEPPEKDLIDNDGNLTEEAKRVFTELFNEFSTDGKMSREQCAKFVTGCTGNVCSQEDTQVSRLYDQYDKDKDGFLSTSDFIDFYTDAARSKKSTVWQNLHMLSYRNDLLRGDQVPLPNVDGNTLPRGIISQSNQKMHILFSLLDSTEVQTQEQAWHLLRRLPPNVEYFRRILTFQGIRKPEDWDSVLSVKSNFRLLYSLHIIEYLMNNNNQNIFNEEIELKERWMSEFLSLGGFDRLLEFFKNYQDISVSVLDINQKEILSFLLKTFSMYLVAACSLRVDGIYKAAVLISQNQMSCEQVLLSERGIGQSIEQHHDFTQLVERLRDGLGASILKKFDLPEFSTVIKGIIDELLSSKQDLETEDRGIIEYGVIMLVVIIKDQQVEPDEYFSTFFNGLYTEKSPTIRNLFARALLVLCCLNDATNHKTLNKLIEQIKDPNYKNTPQLYDLLCQLIDLAQGSYEDLNELGGLVLQTLIDHQSIETRVKGTSIDWVLVGLINLLSQIIQLKQEIAYNLLQDDLTSIIFTECLFSLDGTNEIKCKSNESRSAAFKLLLVLCRGNEESTSQLINYLSQLASYVPSLNKWNHVPSQDMRNGYVGIKNLGCICYMNAMLQQFFMTSPFRYGILMADDGQDENLERRPQDGAMIDDNVLHQLQKMFAFLELSDRVDYNPHEFCFAFKDFTGEPVNVMVQQDSQEFLNMIFDKLETSIKPTPFRYLLDGVYGGKTCTQLKCSQCNYVRNKEEQFYNLSVPIKNLKTLNECFQKYIQGETISDFRCEQCNQKVDVTKNQLLSQLPNVLIIHLQRIVFNLDLLVNEKINHRVEFPMNLDLKQFTLGDVECSQYQLVGIVVHFGTAEYGHYFSYIDIKQNDQWLEFNDSKIRDFKVKQIEKECFGGSTQNEVDDEMWGWNKFNRDNSQNAYILVYEKKVKQPIHLDFIDHEQLQKSMIHYKLPNPLRTEIVDNRYRAYFNYNDLTSYVPKKLNQQVMRDNQQFLMERNLFDTDLQHFILKVISMVDNFDNPQTVIEASRLLTGIGFDLVARASENTLLETFFEKLKQLLKNPQASLEFIQNFFLSRVQKVIDLLLVCPELKTRQMIAKLLACAFNNLINHYKLDLVITELNQSVESLFDEQEDEIEAINFKVVRGLRTMFVLLQDQVPKNWVRLESYFTFWYEFLKGGETQVQFMINNQSLMFLIDFILEKQSPIQLYEKKHSMGNSYFSINYENICQVIIELANMGVDKRYVFSPIDMKLIYNFRFYDRVLKKLTLGPVLNKFIDLIINIAKDHMFYQEIICGCILRGLGLADQDEIPSFLLVVEQLIKMQDKYKTYRIEWLLGIPQMQNHQNRNNSRNQYPHFGSYGMQQLDEDFIRLTSPLGWQYTLLDYFILNRSSKGNDNQSLLVVKTLLKLAIEDQDVFNYLRQIPSTNYIFKNIEDQIDNFIKCYIQDTKKYYFHTFQRETEQASVEQLLQQFQFKLNTLQRQNCNYLIGKTVDTIIYRKLMYILNTKDNTTFVIDYNTPEGQIMYNKIDSDPIFEKQFVLEDKIFRTYICDNKPTGTTNEALPNAFVKGTQFLTYTIPQNITAANFIQPKIWNQVGNNNSEEEKEEEEESLDCISQQKKKKFIYNLIESQVPEQQTVLNPRFEDCVRQISVTSYIYKQIQAIVQILDPNQIAPHYVPVSPIQSILQPNGVAYMYTTKKYLSENQFTHLEFNCIFKSQDSDHSHLYLSSAEKIENELNE